MHTLYLLLVLASVLATSIALFEIWMFIHAFRNRTLPSNTRLLWLVGMLLLHPFVAIAYYFTAYKKA